MTALEFEILSHIYCTPSAFRTCPFWDQIIAKLTDIGAIEASDTENGHAVTTLGKAWITDILSTPVPTIGYLGRDGRMIKE